MKNQSTSFIREIKAEIASLVRTRKYFKPTAKSFEAYLKMLQDKFAIGEKEALVQILNHLASVLENSTERVMVMIRKSKKDIKQARVSVAGNNFQALVAYALMRNIIVGNLPPIRVALKKKKHPLIEKYAVIKVGDETQKPDMDVLIYQDRPGTPLVICSCKTSLRERAGQTYKWKLLVDLATADPQHLKSNPECPINKYKIEYHTDRKIYVTLITADLYGETANPQQRGMLAFFDRSFVADRGKKDFYGNIKPMSDIIDYLNNIFRD